MIQHDTSQYRVVLTFGGGCSGLANKSEGNVLLN
jgi:hypothetical protein